MFAISNKVKMAVIAVVTCAGALQVGCTDREVGAGVAGAVIGAILVDSAGRQPPPPRYERECRIERREHCGTVSDYWGNRVYRCVYRDFDSCRGGWRKSTVGSNSASELALADVADTYALSEDGASKLIAALSAAQIAQDDASAAAAFGTIGVNLEEAKALGQSGSPSPEMVDRIAKSLNQDPKQTAMMVASIAETARAQEAARHERNQN
ncbi:hypothetical protein BH10BDE1_BH10BDE1_19960 [soil metagenome]